MNHKNRLQRQSSDLKVKRMRLMGVLILTCCKLLYGHEREADERERFSQDFAHVLGSGLQLLPASLRLSPANGSAKQTHLSYS